MREFCEMPARVRSRLAKTIHRKLRREAEAVALDLSAKAKASFDRRLPSIASLMNKAYQNGQHALWVKLASSVVIPDTIPPQRVPPPSFIEEELRGLEAIHGPLLAMKNLIRGCESIVGYGVDLGGITLTGGDGCTLEFSQVVAGFGFDSSPFAWTPPDERSSEDGHVHPHAHKHGDVCLGENDDIVHGLLLSGRLCDAFDIMEAVLHTYNPDSPYVHIEDWDGPKCSGCGYVGDLRRCCRCDAEVCLDCRQRFNGGWYCREHFEECPNCGGESPHVLNRLLYHSSGDLHSEVRCCRECMENLQEDIYDEEEEERRRMEEEEEKRLRLEEDDEVSDEESHETQTEEEEDDPELQGPDGFAESQGFAESGASEEMPF